MGIEWTFLCIDGATPSETDEITCVRTLSDALVTHLRSIEPEIDAAHQPNAQSKAIQDLVNNWLVIEGFESEYLGAFAETPGTKSRPDFYLDLGDERGILVEVERGGTVNNNHDLKDIWKCHLSERTQHLILMVPNRNFTREGKPREAPYNRSLARLGTFFKNPRTRIDVLSLTLIGYGPS